MSSLLVENLAVSYGRTEALKGISLRVEPGQVVCLIGANGAGKTTAMRALSGLLRPRAGRITLDGTDITGLRPHRIAALGLLQVPEGRQVFAELTVAENLTLGAWLVTDPAETARRRAAVLERFPRLAERARQYAGSLSGGEQQMLAFGRALMTNPRLLILDEATEGLAPLIRQDIWNCLGALRAQGLSILVVDRNLDALMRLADRHNVVEKGRVVWSGTSTELAAERAQIEQRIGV